MPIGFYTHVAGLGSLPGDVTMDGGVWTDAAWMRRNATCNFWRCVENVTIAPPKGVNMWAISQAAPMRRTHIRGDLHLSAGGWSSGGFLADCKIDGTVKAGRAESPICLQDVFCRVGGPAEGQARCMVAIHDDHVIGDNLWLWRADHGRGVGWGRNRCETGLRVEGDDVTVYALFVEHAQRHQTIWNGNGGRVCFYQSEMPYDPPSREAWRSPTGSGFASYKVGGGVKTHEAWGLGVYHVFKRSAVVADNAIETPTAPGVRIHHAFTCRLYGGRPGSGIRNVINGRGGDVIDREKATVK